MPIKDLPHNLRPREKSILHGISSLSNIELIAIIIRTGSKQDSAISLASKLFEKFGDINHLNKVTVKELMEVRGIGIAKAIEISSLFEMARRINNNPSIYIRSDAEAISQARIKIPNYSQEHFVIVVLSRDNKLIYSQKIVSGKEDSLTVSPKLILSEILKRDGHYAYFFHNHPSGNLKPSANDIMTTESLVYYCELLGISLKAHFILTENSCNEINISDKM